MAMMFCPECAKAISNKALSCPNCGVPITTNPPPENMPSQSPTPPQDQQPILYEQSQQTVIEPSPLIQAPTNPSYPKKKEKKPVFKRWWFWLLVAFGMIILISTCSSLISGNPSPTSEQPVAESVQPATEAETETSIESLVMNNARAVSMRVGGLDDKGWVNVNPRSFDENEIEFISTNPEVASVVAGTKTVGALWYQITARGGGETTIYAQSICGTITSNEIAVSVSSEDFIESLLFNKGGFQSTSSDSYRDWLVVKPSVYDPDVITFVISDESIATIRKAQSVVVGQWFDVYRVSAGTVEIYAVADNGVKSDVLTLTFEE